MTGFSPRNLKYMRKFAESWQDLSIVQEVLAQITWYHNLALLEKADDQDIRLWYAKKTLEYGWSRNILAIQIETRLHERQGKAVSNFEAVLPPTDSDMAAQVFKDPYIFDFLGTADPRREAELEQKLIGLLLVRDKNRTVVEYALAGFTKPIGVAQWERQITQSLPDELKSSLPTVEEIEAELEGGLE
jgi:predicted nuclease of restriction endonuclease-like (RecB) superfamily